MADRVLDVARRMEVAVDLGSGRGWVTRFLFVYVLACVFVPVFLKVLAEAKKSYEKLATLRKEFGHSGSYKSEDGTLYIGKTFVCLLEWVVISESVFS